MSTCLSMEPLRDSFTDNRILPFRLPADHAEGRLAPPLGRTIQDTVQGQRSEKGQVSGTHAKHPVREKVSDRSSENTPHGLNKQNLATILFSRLIIFINLQRTLPQKAFGWLVGRAVYIEKTFTSVCLSCFKTSQFFHITRKMNSNKDVLLMCIYIHPCLSLPKQREVTGVVHIGVGFLRCSFLMIWHCEGLETRNGRR